MIKVMRAGGGQRETKGRDAQSDLHREERNTLVIRIQE